MAKVLIVEDDVNLAESLKDLLQQEKYSVDAVHDGEQALVYLSDGKYDVVVLDLKLPKLSGIDVLRKYRQSRGSAAVIMLTSQSAIQDKLDGLDSGADDYLTKPFDPDELIARVRAQLRRLPTSTYQECLVIGNLTLDLGTHTCKKGARPIKLQPKEYALLEFFMRHPGEVFNANTLLSRVWPADSEVSPESLRFHITNLRNKIDDPDGSSFIETLHRVGYRFGAPDK